MSYSDSLSQKEKEEIAEDSCDAYQAGRISFKELVLCLAKLGYNATDIAEREAQYRPTPPEDGGQG